MSDFDLDAAIGAARRRADSVDSDGAGTRLRIRETLARDHTRRARRATFVAGVIATLFGSTAFAYYTHWRPGTAVHVTAEAPPAPVPAPDLGEVRPPAARVAVHDDPPPQIVAIEPMPAREPTHVAAAVAAVPEVPAPPDPELAAYRVAHEAHFHGSSPAAALQAWDAYLAAYPNGTLAIDARWSRALILIKLKRWGDAAAALHPFADAPAGAYRQAEAAKLLAALPH